ncbi:MAG: hypothetical protein WBG05_18015, partial [Thermoanaerobaculia bacterium]
MSVSRRPCIHAPGRPISAWRRAGLKRPATVPAGVGGGSQGYRSGRRQAAGFDRRRDFPAEPVET